MTRSDGAAGRARRRGRSGPGAEPIAIIGMSGRVPGAEDLDQFWHNLAGGVESITTLSAEDMHATGVPEAVTSLPGYVNAAPLLGDVDRFDAAFFGFSARDAALTDPQHRLFLETAWAALEDAGYDPGAYPGSIGVFGGCEMSTYLYQLSQNPDTLGYIDGMQLMVTNDKDHLCTQVSYRLDLRGPSVVVQTTCSTSLVAVAMACESLQSGRSDLALAGGVTVRVPQRGGYLYVAGSILSPDGHCRPFDASAQGTIVGSGVGLVVLKRLDDALADGDSIRATILGFGVNNDGSDKVGYTAPAFKGQVAAITSAYRMADVSPESIGYVEAHGTGTILGDPIEVAALTEVFRSYTPRRGFCGIGSVKSNVGHLSCASGVTGLIKAVLTLEHGAIPPTVHYRTPNPALGLASSPFFVTDTLHPWERNGGPRRAAVSSFGVGGTNAHAILEEAPPATAPPATASPRRRPYQLLTLSARSDEALDQATRRLGTYLTRHPERDLADAAYTLHVGRRAFRHRRGITVASDDRAAAVAALLQPGPEPATESGADAPPVVFMFPGQGSQYPGMAAGLYATEPLVKRTIDYCCRVLKPELGLDLRRVLFPAARRRSTADAELRDTALAQPALFVVEYALAQLWRSWGVEPTAMIGHSIGEYVAATISGVMELDDALRLLALRGRLISSLPPGSMLAVMLPADAVAPYVDEEVCLAAVNAPGLCVLSGPTPAIARVQEALEARSVVARTLHTSHAFHSSMMDPVLDEYESLLADVPLSPPTIPYVATLDGEWAGDAVLKPSYWSAQIRSAVRFDEGLTVLGAKDSPAAGDPAFLEVGPGRTLLAFVARGDRGVRPARMLASLPAPGQSSPDVEVVCASLGRLWESGVAVDWPGFHGSERRRRVSLPTYPFERQSYWIGKPNRPGSESDAEPRDPADWFATPVWEHRQDPGEPQFDLAGARILVFDDGAGAGAAVTDALRAGGAVAIVVRRGTAFDRIGDEEYRLDPADADGFGALAAAVCGGGRLGGVVHCWAAAPPGDSDLEDTALVAFLSPLRLAVALGSQATVRPLPMLLVARGTAQLGTGDVLDPPRAFGIGAAKVLPQEHSGLRVAHIDVDGSAESAVQLLADLSAGAPESEVALRAGRRFARTYEPVPIADTVPPPGLPAAPVLLITGGLGHMGLLLAEAAFFGLGARLVLVGRSALPPPDQWAALSTDLTVDETRRGLLRRLALMRAERDDVLVVGADLNDPGQLTAAVDVAVARFGEIDLVVHGAANVGPAAFGLAADTGLSVVRAQISPKILGLLHLIEAMRGREPKRLVIHGSISSVLGGLGLAAYAGANAVLDTIADQQSSTGTDAVSVVWDAWDNAGEAQTAAIQAIMPAEGQEAFLRLLGAPVGSRVVVAAHDLQSRLESWVRMAKLPRAGAAAGHPRPNLSTAFVAPRTDTERALAYIWASQLGLDEVGIHDRFFDLGGHSLLAVQVASEIRDEFQVEMPVVQLFKAPTISELALSIEQARTVGDAVPDGASGDPSAGASADAGPAVPDIEGDGPGAEAKARYRQFYDEMTRRLEATGMAEASFFLNYGYLSLGTVDEARFDVPDGVFNPSSIRLAYELIGPTEVSGLDVLDVGCGRGGTAALLAETFGAGVTGVDLSPEAIAFCARTHRHPGLRFDVGDAEHLPLPDDSCDVVTNLESSHTYPDMRAFLAEVGRVLRSGGQFLHADLLAEQRWMEVRAILHGLGFDVTSDREITANVLASCDEVAGGRTQAFGDRSALIDNFLAVPGSPVYEQMNTGAWQYRIMRSRLR
jgi:phthiocerol/phenolphthiocerol synthesis type-I polyketide synthase E